MDGIALSGEAYYSLGGLSLRSGVTISEACCCCAAL